MPDITINGQDGAFGAYIALPASTPAPGIVVAQEIFGVNQVMRDICDWLAGQGYVAYCPDLFWRIEPGIQITDKTEAEWARAFELFGLFDVDKGIEDMKATLAQLRGHEACNGKAGSVGYCLGGKIAYLMATRSDADCSVSYYGVGLEEMLAEAANITKPLTLHIAEKDQFVPPEAQMVIKDTLKDHPHITLHVYDGQDHAFAREGGAHFDQAAADLANGRTLDVFPEQSDVMTHAIRIHRPGGPEELVWDEVEVGQPGPGEVLLRHSAVGLNFIDVYHRTGLYPLPAMPSGIGLEAAGVVEAVGEGVGEVAVGDRVAYAAPPIGAYAEARLMPADRLVKITDAVEDQQAAAMMLQGMTVQYLIRRTYRVQPGDTVLFHAAAGGVGLIACQWLKHLGATVIGTVGSEEKAALAKAHGCDHTIFYRTENVAERVREITHGAGVPVAYDSVGKDTFEGSLDCLAPLGMMVSFGNSSGPVAPFDAGVLAAKGSLFLTRPTLMTYIAKREDLVATAAELFQVVGSGAVKIHVKQTYPLAEAAQAHRDLEARKTTGSTVLLP